MGKFSEAFGISHDKKEETGPPPPSFSEATTAYHPPPSSAGPSTSFNANQPTAFACLLLASSDRIRTVNFPESTLAPMEEAIRRVWAPGVQAQGYKTPGNYEWKLSGRPWYGSASEAIPSRRLIVHIIHALAAIGWHVHISADLTKKQYDKDSLFFKTGPPLQRYFFSITFNESDKVRIIDSPNDTVLEAFKTVVAQSWGVGIQDQKWKEDGCWQIKLRGTPFYTSSGDQINQTRLLMCNLLGVMDHHGFELVASVDQSIGSDNVGELDSWYFASKLPNGQRV